MPDMEDNNRDARKFSKTITDAMRTEDNTPDTPDWFMLHEAGFGDFADSHNHKDHEEQVPFGMWRCSGCGKIIRDDWSSCPHCHTSKNGNPSRTINDDMYSKNSSGAQVPSWFTPHVVVKDDAPQKTMPQQPPTSYGRHQQPSVAEIPQNISYNLEVGRLSAKPAYTIGGSPSAKFLKFLGIFLFIVGLIVAFSGSWVISELSYYAEEEFSFVVFAKTYTLYVVAGSFSLCAAELLENVKRIADSLTKIEITKD